jgi:hypothetical protein
LVKTFVVYIPLGEKLNDIVSMPPMHGAACDVQTINEDCHLHINVKNVLQLMEGCCSQHRCNSLPEEEQKRFAEA